MHMHRHVRIRSVTISFTAAGMHMSQAGVASSSGHIASALSRAMAAPNDASAAGAGKEAHYSRNSIGALSPL